MSRMQGKVALISGGAEGIGGATGRRIVAEGGVVLPLIADNQSVGNARRAVALAQAAQTTQHRGAAA